MAAPATPQLLAVRSTLPRSTIVASAAFVLAGGLRLASASEQLTLSLGYAAFFLVVAAAQITYGVMIGGGSRRAAATPYAVTAMLISLGLIGLWLVATTATVPIYPLMNGSLAVDVIDLGSTLLEATAVFALCRSLPVSQRRKVVWTLVGLVATAWLVWTVIVTVTGLSD
jgi:hypothetical protein